MDGAFLLLVLFGVLLFWVFAVWVVLGGVPIMPLAGGMGTLDMLGSNFSWELILMGIWLIDRVAGCCCWDMAPAGWCLGGLGLVVLGKVSSSNWALRLDFVNCKSVLFES